MIKLNKAFYYVNSCLLLLDRRSCSQVSSISMEKPSLEVSERLSKSVLPQNYRITLNPDLEAGTFSGNVNIRIDVKDERDHIRLHTKFLQIHNVKVYNKIKEVPISKYYELNQLEYIFIKFVQNITPGIYSVDIGFTGNLTNKFIGFYASRFKKGVMAASKFQPTYAREAFPCFDEPEYKATFDITLVKPHSFIALSNMNEISTIHNEMNNVDEVTFATSVPMSTYLACFVICDFHYLEENINSNKIGKDFKLRTFSQKDQLHKITFALDIAQRATEFYINYYQIPFPLPKLDMIAIPDYVSGATEHWGLITYRETSFLIDEKTASTTNKRNVAGTIAHELAHMWFGNLVTMKWWDDLWLNEGFATYMQFKALNAIEPSWTMLEQFLVQILLPALAFDSKLSSHPIVQTVNTPDQITAIFDIISYNKGASVLRMFEGILGEENFRRGIKDYLKKHQFGVTVTKDLLESLDPYFTEKNPGLNISYILDTWTRQTGYPLLTVNKASEPGSYFITQKRFLLDPHAKIEDNSPFSYRWYVPITYKTNNGDYNDIIWFPNKADKVVIDVKESDTWIKVNNNQIGYYRVNYPREMWFDLIAQLQLKSDSLTISDRVHLLNDIFALAEAHILPYDLALDLTTYLKVEDQYVPWATAASIFGKLKNKLLNSAAHTHLMVYVQALITPLYETQSWDNNPKRTVIEGLIRSTVLTIATKYGVPSAQKNVKRLFLDWLNSYENETVHLVEPDLRDLVYYYGMKSGSIEEWDRLWQIYLKEEDAQERAKLRSALAASDDSHILAKYLTLAWDEKYVRSQDYLIVLDYIARTPAGAALVWDDVRARWPLYVERFSLNSRYLGNMVAVITADFNTENRLREMESFFAEYPEAGAGEAARRRALENVRLNIQWAEQHEKLVASWLEQHV